MRLCWEHNFLRQKFLRHAPEEIDTIGLKPLERGLGNLLDVLRAAVHAGLRPLFIEVEAEFGGNHDLVTKGGQGFADELLVGERAVDFRGVEERDATLDGRPDR